MAAADNETRSANDDAPGGFFGGISAWKKSLPNPGLFEQLHKETRGVFVTNFLFDGAKFDFAKFLSPNFQVSHSFALGSQVAPPSYHFGATYGTEKVNHFSSLSSVNNCPFVI